MFSWTEGRIPCHLRCQWSYDTYAILLRHLQIHPSSLFALVTLTLTTAIEYSSQGTRSYLAKFRPYHMYGHNTADLPAYLFFGRQIIKPITVRLFQTTTFSFSEKHPYSARLRPVQVWLLRILVMLHRFLRHYRVVHTSRFCIVEQLTLQKFRYAVLIVNLPCIFPCAFTAKRADLKAGLKSSGLLHIHSDITRTHDL